jgi:protein-S-isoprenylcysteine O-methyltransferase Ste14
VTPDQGAAIYDPVKEAEGRPWLRRLNYLQDALLVCVSALFFYAQVVAVTRGNFLSVAFAAEQAILVALFLFRRRSRATSRRPFDWIVAAGGFLPLLARPNEGDGSLALAGFILQTGGFFLVVAGMLALGRSFGVVAANRGLKVSGPYRVVRHPIYLAHIISTGGYVMTNFSYWNLAIYLATATCHLLRIRAEERVLTLTDSYADYARRVRWRLIPGLY